MDSLTQQTVAAQIQRRPGALAWSWKTRPDVSSCYELIRNRLLLMCVFHKHLRLACRIDDSFASIDRPWDSTLQAQNSSPPVNRAPEKHHTRTSISLERITRALPVWTGKLPYRRLVCCHCSANTSDRIRISESTFVQLWSPTAVGWAQLPRKWTQLTPVNSSRMPPNKLGLFSRTELLRSRLF